MVDPSGVTREEFERLQRRVADLEAELAETRPPAVAPLPLAERIAAPPPPPPHSSTPPTTTPIRPAKAPVGFETLLGERFAPRIGALLVFLAALFFLGVGIQRGWIGPALQLTIAATSALALVGIAAWLTSRKGYGRYPQVLEGTAMAVLYATTFVAHALPYYRAVTGLTELGGGIAMALVALATVALALWRDARPIASLGYALAFITAGFGLGAMPAITVPYVALLGTSLALLVARKRWWMEASLGTLVTGAFFVLFAFDAPGVAPWVAFLTSLAPLAAFLALATSRRREPAAPDGHPALVMGATLAWGAFASAAHLVDASVPAAGLAVLVWTLVAGALTATAAALGAERGASGAAGTMTVILYVIMAPLLWWESPMAADMTTLTYAAGALLLAVSHLAAPPRARLAMWGGGVVLGVLAALKAASSDLQSPDATATGSLLSAILVAATLLVLRHARSRSIDAERARLGSYAVVGGSAIVLVAWLIEHAAGAAASILIGVLGVAYLAAGFIVRAWADHRHVGFAALAIVLARIFTVDLREADLVVRALVFAVLGLILLGVGFVYARARRREAGDVAATDAEAKN